MLKRDLEKAVEQLTQENHELSVQNTVLKTNNKQLEERLHANALDIEGMEESIKNQKRVSLVLSVIIVLMVASVACYFLI